jgi:hypothetical protein
MPVVTMPAVKPNSQAALSATLPDLHRFIASFPFFRISEEECESLAAAAAGGHPEAEFVVGSIFDATDEPARDRVVLPLRRPRLSACHVAIVCHAQTGSLRLGNILSLTIAE